MSEKRETILRLTQDATGKITDVKIFQETPPEKPETPEEPETPEKPLTVIELKPETRDVILKFLAEGSVVDWGDGTKSTVTAEDVLANSIGHFYAAASASNRIVAIDGVINRPTDFCASPFPENLIIYIRSIGEITGGVMGLFSNCRSLTSLPEDLFDNFTAETNFSFCFKNCESLKSLPKGLFNNCTAGTDFSFCFENCTSLTEIPKGLFDSCTAATNFTQCFRECQALTGETPYTMVDGKKIKLWERSPENGFAKVTEYRACFGTCHRLSDYAEIPDDWK